MLDGSQTSQKSFFCRSKTLPTIDYYQQLLISGESSANDNAKVRIKKIRPYKALFAGGMPRGNSQIRVRDDVLTA